MNGDDTHHESSLGRFNRRTYAFGVPPRSFEEATMKPVTVINHFAIKPDKMDEFIAAQQNFAATLMQKSNGLSGGRMYRSIDGKSAVLVSQFESASAQEGIRQSDSFRQHVSRLRLLIESASPNLYEEAYTTGDFK
jgi:quinol monooxygenase YgiN